MKNLELAQYNCRSLSKKECLNVNGGDRYHMWVGAEGSAYIFDTWTGTLYNIIGGKVYEYPSGEVVG